MFSVACNPLQKYVLPTSTTMLKYYWAQLASNPLFIGVTQSVMANARALNPNCDIQWGFHGTKDALNIYSKCPCGQIQGGLFNSSALNALCSAVGHPSNGPHMFQGGYVDTAFPRPSHMRNLQAVFPASSPWVLSVGGTAKPANTAVTQDKEVTCSTWNGALITSGGGFSPVDPRPAWQNAAVAGWRGRAGNLETLMGARDAPDALTGRGYPDVSALARRYYVSGMTPAHPQLPPPSATAFPADGTSASAPVVASMITLINDKLLGMNKPTMGFVNPLLYQMATAKPAAINDVAVGDNKCSQIACCKYGYDATVGWDPVTGLGSLNFEEFRAYALSVAPPAAPPPPTQQIVQSMTFPFTATEFTNDLKSVLEIAYGLMIGIYDAQSKKYRSGCSVIAKIASRRIGRGLLQTSPSSTVQFTATAAGNYAAGAVSASSQAVSNPASFTNQLATAQTAAGVTIPNANTMTPASVGMPVTTTTTVQPEADSSWSTGVLILLAIVCVVGLMIGLYALLHACGIINNRDGRTTVVMQTEDPRRQQGDHDEKPGGMHQYPQAGDRTIQI